MLGEYMDPNSTNWVERIDQEAKELREVMHNILTEEKKECILLK